jgi:hypothetical protein
MEDKKEMKEKVLIPFFGVVIFLALLIISEYIMKYFNMFPYQKLLSIIEAGDFKEFAKLAEKIISIYVFFVIPSVSFITALLIGLIAKRKHHLMATVSIVPFYITLLLILLLIKSFYIYSLYAILTFEMPVIAGVHLARYLKR